MSAGRTCGECGAAIPADSPGQFCARCLLGLGLRPESSGEPSEAGAQSSDGGPPPSPPEDPKSNPGVTALLTEKPGDWIGPYRLLQEIGQGGCGAVYMAEQEKPLRRRVALKIIKLGMDTKQVVARFDAERQALALMDHPNIAKVLDAGATETGRPFFVMELVGGIKITDYCDQNQLTTRQRLDLFIQVSRAVQHAHQKGIIHRDIKPSNVLVATQDGVPVPKVIDFGIAKATQGRLTDHTLFTAFEQFLGTPAYMSPEQTQLGSLDVDTRSDIYSLGVLLYELLTGTTPFDTKELVAAGLDEMRRTIREVEPVKPSTRLTQAVAARSASPGKSEIRNPKSEIDRDLDWIVMKCLEKDRTRRYETANGLARDIERYLNTEPVVARPPSRLYALQKTVRRHRFGLAAAAALAAVVLLGGVGVLLEWRRAEDHALREQRERQRAEQEAQRAQFALNQMQAIEIHRAEECYEVGDRRLMLAYLALVLRQNPTNRIAAERLFSALSHRNWARLACPPMLHSNRVTSAVFSPNGRWVATAGADNTARVWDAATGQPAFPPLTHQAEIDSAEFSLDGKLVATASSDNTARVWDALTGQPVTDPILHPARVELARFSPDGRILVTLCDDRAARLWNPRTGKLILPPLQHGEGASKLRFFRDATFSPDGLVLATAPRSEIVQIWDARKGVVVQQLNHGAGHIGCVRFSADGRRLATGTYGSGGRVWDLAQNPPQAVLFPHPGNVVSIEFSPDEQRVVTASSDKNAQVWNARTGEKIGPPLRHSGEVRSAKFSPEGLRVATASWDRTARVWDADTGEPLTEPIPLEDRGFAAEFHPDGQHILTASHGRAVSLWDITPAQPLTIFLPRTPLWSAGFSPDGKRLVVCNDLQNTLVCDVLTGKKLATLDGALFALGCAVNDEDFTPDGHLVALAVDGGAFGVFDCDTGRRLTPARWFHTSNVVTARFSHDLRSLVTASADTTARVWDAHTGEPRAAPMCHETAVHWAEFSPDDRLILTASRDSVAKIWDARSAQVVRGLQHEDQVRSAHFSSDGARVLTASHDMKARVWDTRTGTVRGTLPHRLPVVSAVFSPDDRRIATTAGDVEGQVRLWDAYTFQPLTKPITRGRSVHFSPDGETLIVGATYGANVSILDAWSGERYSESLQPGERNLFSLFSPQGGFVLAANNECVRLWEAPRVWLPVPNWLLDLAEAIAGQRFDPRGGLESVLPGELWGLQQKLSTPKALKDAPTTSHDPPHEFAPSQDYSRWAQWFLAEPSRRTVLPSSPLTVADYAQSLADQRVSPAAVRQALLLQPTNAIVLRAAALTNTNFVHLIRALTNGSIPKAR